MRILCTALSLVDTAILHTMPSTYRRVKQPEGTKTMAEKKAEGKQNSTHLSLASRMLGAGLRGKLGASPLDEPWRQKNSKRKSNGKRRK
jgi:hypothetical protein